MWVKQCHKPGMTRNCKHTTYKNGHDCGDGANGIVLPTLFSHDMFVQMRFFLPS